MTLTVWIRVLAGITLVTAFIAIGVAWRAEMSDRAGLAAELASTSTALEAAEARQQERDAKLADTLAAIAKQKRTIQSPAQIAKDLPLQMHLPSPIVLQNASGTHDAVINGGATVAVPGAAVAPPAAAGKASNVQAVIPGDDLKPLYDFALDCQACQASLAASQSNLADEQGKTKALTRERDDALRVARGGSVLRRIARASKWMLIGAAAGALAARAVH